MALQAKRTLKIKYLFTRKKPVETKYRLRVIVKADKKQADKCRKLWQEA